ncbi:BLUF domain-containing protein [Curtobacterium sp. VKM Ac-2922]|uniref:BLUF domain-containing protein n=1 Tax=Curtobacterium sp. VKM Ac-2922 TaxID=2929475 RepID=UPI001FB314E8|nr:BLUF domain-containing protein [Curtobacterium sp. VKM Ac-2922]MCJ1714967.1 BLUF domain-containing protein [Curtobacterium sp. VKM Ac-2922]
MLSLTYSSVATSTLEPADLTALLTQSRASNEHTGITGMLLFRNGYFLQVLEGPDAQVRQKMRTIRDDPRHTKVTVLLEEVIQDREFPEWTMGFPSEQELEDVPGYRATFDDLDAHDGDAMSAVPAVRQLVRWFRQRAA